MNESINAFCIKMRNLNSKIKTKTMDFISNHPELFCISLLAILCFLFLFVGLNFYPLLDVDETRYAVMAKNLINSSNWNSLMLNYAPFLEKPPLYFWMVGASIKLWGGFTEFAVRLPIALSASFLTFFTYFIGRKVISRKFGMLSALILLSSVFFLMLSHVAIIDMILTVLVSSAIYCGFLAQFVKESNKKYCWWYFYLFIGLGFLAKGLLAIVLPIVVVFFYYLCAKNIKEMFKPVNIIPGAVLFLLVSMPWHILMYLEYGKQFIIQYFLIHHFARFVNSEFIGRERPFLYFVPVFIIGFMPWTFVFIAFIVDGCKKLAKRYSETQGNFIHKVASWFEVKNNEESLVLFASIYFIIVFVFFSISSTKLPTYILPAFPAAALLTGYYWWVSDEKNQHEKAIYNTTQLFAAIFILAAVIASVAYWFLPAGIEYMIEPMKTVTICGLCLLGIFLLLRLRTKRALSIFGAYILTMLFVITIAVTFIFNMIYSGGENEIVDFSRSAQLENAKLVTFDFSVKPSSMIGYHGAIVYILDSKFNDLDDNLTYPGQVFVIVKNKNLEDPAYKKKISDRLILRKVGQKYSLFAKKTKGDFKTRRYNFSYMFNTLTPGKPDKL